MRECVPGGKGPLVRSETICGVPKRTFATKTALPARLWLTKSSRLSGGGILPGASPWPFAACEPSRKWISPPIRSQPKLPDSTTRHTAHFLSWQGTPWKLHLSLAPWNSIVSLPGVSAIFAPGRLSISRCFALYAGIRFSASISKIASILGGGTTRPALVGQVRVSHFCTNCFSNSRYRSLPGSSCLLFEPLGLPMFKGTCSSGEASEAGGDRRHRAATTTEEMAAAASSVITVCLWLSALSWLSVPAPLK
mmetsp:Transcript_23334/g.66447  ORF Transcript_23334/g.66447 Transcript_23334/m.66447 type:complete len:251 (+) Transcript_23334:235-987(+)